MADFRFARAVKYRRCEGNALAEAFGDFQQLIVVKLRERLPNCGVRENFAEPAPDRFRTRFLVEKTGEAVTQLLGSPAEVRLENLADVHTRRNAKRVENDLDGSAVGHIGHVFLRHDAGNDALVAVAAGHFVADGKLALHGDIDLDQLDDARRQLVALLELILALLGDLAEHVDLPRGHLLDFLDFLDEQGIFFVELQALEVARGDFFDNLARQLGALGQQALVGLLVVQVGLKNLAAEQIVQALEALIREDADFVGEVFLQLENLRGFAFGRDLADKNVAGLHHRADADHTAFVEVAKEGLADVGNVARDFLGAEFGVARFDFVLLDVNRSVIVVLHQFFADQDGVFEVVAAPREKRHEDVAPQGQLAALGARAVGQHLALFHAVAHAHERLLADAGVLVRTLELDELIDVRTHFAAEHAGVIGLHAHDDALGVDLIDDAFALAEYDRAGIARSDAFHAGADERRFTLDQRHSLALHVGTHQRAVGVVIFEERDQAGSHGNQLLR